MLIVGFPIICSLWKLDTECRPLDKHTNRYEQGLIVHTQCLPQGLQRNKTVGISMISIDRREMNMPTGAHRNIQVIFEFHIYTSNTFLTNSVDIPTGA
jgi:hypothetical protein